MILPDDSGPQVFVGYSVFAIRYPLSEKSARNPLRSDLPRSIGERQRVRCSARPVCCSCCNMAWSR